MAALAITLLTVPAAAPPARGGEVSYHPGYQDGDCSDCHEGKPGRIGTRHSDLCHTCHDRKDAARFLHGPVAAGLCTYCHDPHGSAQKAFLTRTVWDLCVSCHDQPSSGDHLRRSAGRSCEGCHNPHGSGKKFFLF
jgi:predicted CXXCH cytochrome family protein